MQRPHWGYRSQPPLPTRLQAQPTTNRSSPQYCSLDSRACLGPGSRAGGRGSGRGEAPACSPLCSPRRCWPGRDGDLCPRRTLLTPALRPQRGAGGHSGTQASPYRCNLATALGGGPRAVMQGGVEKGRVGRAGAQKPIPGGGLTRELRPHAPILVSFPDKTHIQRRKY